MFLFLTWKLIRQLSAKAARLRPTGAGNRAREILSHAQASLDRLLCFAVDGPKLGDGDQAAWL